MYTEKQVTTGIQRHLLDIDEDKKMGYEHCWKMGKKNQQWWKWCTWNNKFQRAFYWDVGSEKKIFCIWTLALFIDVIVHTLNLLQFTLKKWMILHSQSHSQKQFKKIYLFSFIIFWRGRGITWHYFEDVLFLMRYRRCSFQDVSHIY